MLNTWGKTLVNIKLAPKFTILLALLFLGAILFSGGLLATTLNHNAQATVTEEARLLLKMMGSVRNYTSTQIRPELADRLEEEFLPQSVPAYSAREIFEIFRADKSVSDYFYKEATLNPTNLRDKADSFETEIVNRFREQTNLKELQGIRSTSGQKLFYIAQPLAVTKESCLQCHSTVEAAPKSMVERYGPNHGYNWKLNEIVSAKMIYIPASQVFQRSSQLFILVMGSVVVIFAAAILLVNRWLNRLVIRPLLRMTRVADALSKGDLEAEFEQKSNDEIGSLAQAFTRMKTSLSMCMNRLEQFSTERRSRSDQSE